MTPSTWVRSSAAALDQYLRRLNGTGYFASAQAAIEADPTKADDATVKLAVIEAPTKTFEAGVGYSTDTEFRVNASYRNVDINGHGLQLYADGRIETLTQSASIRFVQPPGGVHGHVVDLEVRRSWIQVLPSLISDHI